MASQATNHTTWKHQRSHKFQFDFDFSISPFGMAKWPGSLVPLIGRSLNVSSGAGVLFPLLRHVELRTSSPYASGVAERLGTIDLALAHCPLLPAGSQDLYAAGHDGRQH